MHHFCPQPPEWNWLRRRSHPSKPPRRPWGWLLLGALAAELVALALRPEHAPVPTPEVDGAVLVTSDPAWGEKPVRRIIPPAPPEGANWERPPCREPWMHVISGACWAKVAGAEPPCSSGLYEHRGGCFAPVTKGQRPPSSIRR